LKKEPLFSRNFILICLASFASFSSFYFLLATLPVYVIQLGGSESEVGLIIGVFSASAVVLRLFIGGLSDIHGAKLFILIGTALLSVCSGLYALAATTFALLLIRVFHGAAWASFGTAASALVADIVPKTRRGEAMGYYGMASNLAMAIGPALGIYFMQKRSFPFLFIVSAILALVSTFLSSFIIKETESKSASKPVFPGFSALIEKTALYPAAVLCLVAVTYGSIVSFLPVYAVKKNISNPGWFFTVYAITLLLARSYTGILSDRRGRGFVIVPGLVLAVAALSLLAFANSLVVFLAAAFLYGLAFAAIQPAIIALVIDRAPKNRRGAAMATFSMSMDVGIGGGSFLWGFIAQVYNYETIYLSSSFIAFAAIFIFVFAPRLKSKT